MSKKVLSVGQCNPDHNALKNFLEKHFDCEITRIDSTEEALEQLKKENFDLIFVNRKLDIDYTDGTILIQSTQSNPQLKNIPIMLISNYPEYQEEAVSMGAKYGIGKSEYGKPESVQRVSQFLTLKKGIVH